MTTDKGNKLIAEFNGYVQSNEHNVHLHSAQHGFKGSNGYSEPFIRKDQFDLLMGFYNSGDQISIDKFYESTRSATRLPYIFNGVHLFLTAWNNKSTQLDWMPCKLKYHEDWGMLMPVVEKIWGILGNRESMFYFSVSEDLTIYGDDTTGNNISDCWDAVVNFIEWYNNQDEL